MGRHSRQTLVIAVTLVYLKQTISFGFLASSLNVLCRKSVEHPGKKVANQLKTAALPLPMRKFTDHSELLGPRDIRQIRSWTDDFVACSILRFWKQHCPSYEDGEGGLHYWGLLPYLREPLLIRFSRQRENTRSANHPRSRWTGQPSQHSEAIIRPITANDAQNKNDPSQFSHGQAGRYTNCITSLVLALDQLVGLPDLKYNLYSAELAAADLNEMMSKVAFCSYRTCWKHSKDDLERSVCVPFVQNREQNKDELNGYVTLMTIKPTMQKNPEAPNCMLERELSANSDSPNANGVSADDISGEGSKCSLHRTEAMRGTLVGRASGNGEFNHSATTQQLEFHRRKTNSSQPQFNDDVCLLMGDGYGLLERETRKQSMLGNYTAIIRSLSKRISASTRLSYVALFLAIKRVRFAKFVACLQSLPQRIRSSPRLSWATLGFAIGMEIAGNVLLKVASDASSRTVAVLSLALELSSIALFGLTLKQIEMGVGYAVWAAVGTAAVSLVGIVFWSESRSPTKLVSLALIILGVVGLNLSD